MNQLMILLVSLMAYASIGATSSFGAVRLDPVEYKLGQTTYKGFVAFDDAASGKRPGVLVVHEWWGCNEYAQTRARMLAELGYVAIAVDMYGAGQTTTSPEEAGKLAGAVYADPKAMRALINGWLGVLKARPEVDPSRTGAIGYCFGGATVLELARSGADVGAVVSFHGNLATQSPAGPGQVKARVLVCNGADDPFIPAEDPAKFKAEMKAAGADYAFIDYGGTVHSFTNKAVDAFNIPGAKYNEQADRRSWAAMKALFEESFGK